MTEPVNLYNIYIGDFSSPASQEMMKIIDDAAANMGGSPWFHIKTAYYQINADHSIHYESDQASFISRTQLLQTARGIVMNDSFVAQSLLNLFNSGKLKVDEDAVYNIIFRGDFQYSGWLQTWCGYHHAFYLNDGRIIKYTVVGDSSTAPNGGECQEIVGNMNGPYFTVCACY